MSTHTCEQPNFHLTDHNCISTKATRTLCFSFIFIPVLLWILNCLFLNVRCCHIPFVLRACKNLCCICGGTNREVIPVKYGRELTLTRYMHPLQIGDLLTWENTQPHIKTKQTKKKNKNSSHFKKQHKKLLQHVKDGKQRHRTHNRNNHARHVNWAAAGHGKFIPASSKFGEAQSIPTFPFWQKLLTKQKTK